MNKLKIIIIVILIVLLVASSGAGIYLYMNYFRDEKYIVPEDTADAFKDTITFDDCEAKFIRATPVADKDLWTCFRKKINIAENVELKNIIAHISVDSQYWLYINGNCVVKQGGLKRGEEIKSIYYEDVDITNYLTKGENIIAVLTWYWGRESISYATSGTAGFLFQTQIGEEMIISDETWKTTPNPAYVHRLEEPNYRLAEFHINYNANLEIDGWTSLDFDDSNWENANVICNGGEEPFGKMILRDIPDFKYSELKEYENSSQYINYTTTEPIKIEVTIPYNAQFNPYFEIESPKDKLITIYTDQYYDINGDSLLTVYTTKEGYQEFEGLSWINRRKSLL